MGLLDDIKCDLKFISEAETDPWGNPTSNVICIAAHAGVLIADKYLALIKKCKIYKISIGTLFVSCCGNDSDNQ